MMFNKFTERAQKMMVYAQKEAEELNHGYVGTEHVLLGILKEEDGLCKKSLNNMKITLEKVKKLVVEYEGEGDAEIRSTEIPLTPRTKRLLELSLLEARNLNHNYVSPEHILLALIRDAEGVAYTILANLGADFDKLKNDILNNWCSEDTPKGSLSKENKQNNTPTLNHFGKDLTEMAREGKLDPVIGRDNETQRLLEVLCRRMKNNPCLIGEAGVGKTAIAEGLAQRIASGNIPESLKDKRVITLDISSMVAGSKYRGEFEERLKKVMKEILESG
ncbi:MAG: AAA family ATPase, partial [Clostridiaceae bacterium]|nr:AAA family ATPase [Clostridiaceae bacterium]